MLQFICCRTQKENSQSSYFQFQSNRDVRGHIYVCSECSNNSADGCTATIIIKSTDLIVNILQRLLTVEQPRHLGPLSEKYKKSV